MFLTFTSFIVSYAVALQSIKGNVNTKGSVYKLTYSSILIFVFENETAPTLSLSPLLQVVVRPHCLNIPVIMQHGGIAPLYYPSLGNFPYTDIQFALRFHPQGHIQGILLLAHSAVLEFVENVQPFWGGKNMARPLNNYKVGDRDWRTLKNYPYCSETFLCFCYCYKSLLLKLFLPRFALLYEQYFVFPVMSRKIKSS